MRLSLTRYLVFGITLGMGSTFAMRADAFFLRMSAADCFVNRGTGPNDQFLKGNPGAVLLDGNSANVNDRQAFCPYPETDPTLKSSLRTVNVHAATTFSNGQFKAAACISHWNLIGGFCDPLVTSQKFGTQRLDVALGAPAAWSNGGDGHFPYVWVTSENNGATAFLKGIFFAD